VNCKAPSSGGGVDDDERRNAGLNARSNAIQAGVEFHSVGLEASGEWIALRTHFAEVERFDLMRVHEHHGVVREELTRLRVLDDVEAFLLHTLEDLHAVRVVQRGAVEVRVVEPGDAVSGFLFGGHGGLFLVGVLEAG
jgi:hypothetical protein